MLGPLFLSALALQIVVCVGDGLAVQLHIRRPFLVLKMQGDSVRLPNSDSQKASTSVQVGLDIDRLGTFFPRKADSVAVACPWTGICWILDWPPFSRCDVAWP